MSTEGAEAGALNEAVLDPRLHVDTDSETVVLAGYVRRGLHRVPRVFIRRWSETYSDVGMLVPGIFAGTGENSLASPIFSAPSRLVCIAQQYRPKSERVADIVFHGLVRIDLAARTAEVWLPTDGSGEVASCVDLASSSRLEEDFHGVVGFPGEPAEGTGRGDLTYYLCRLSWAKREVVRLERLRTARY